MMKEKTLLMKRKEFIDKLADVINSSELPPVILEPIIGRLHEQVSNALESAYLEELAAYEKGADQSA